MKYLLFIFSLTTAIHSLGQKFDLKIDSVINLEIEKKIDRQILEIGYTKLVCVNYGISSTAYLFWKEGEKTYIQKFKDSEYDKVDVRRFKPVAFVDSVFFLFFKINDHQLTTEEVKPFQYQTDRTIATSHSCFRHFRLFTGDIVFNKYFDFFDLQEFDAEQIDYSKLSRERIEELRQMNWEVDTLYKNVPRRNINYKGNTELKLTEWDLILSKFIEKIESMNQFVEIRN